MTNKFRSLAVAALALLFTTQAFAVTYSGTPGIPLPETVRQKLNTSPLHSYLVKMGDQVTTKKVNVLKATYDFADQGGNVGVIKLKDASGGDAILPDNALVKFAWIDVLTAPLSGGTTTLSLGVETATDIKGSTAKASFTGVLDGVPDGTATNKIKTTGAHAVYLTVGTTTLTAGAFNVFIEYYLSD